MIKSAKKKKRPIFYFKLALGPNFYQLAVDPYLQYNISILIF